MTWQFIRLIASTMVGFILIAAIVLARPNVDELSHAIGFYGALSLPLFICFASVLFSILKILKLKTQL